MSYDVSNTHARWAWLHVQGLSGTPVGPCNADVVQELIADLGYVQLDPIRIVARAHDHILWTRNNAYRESHLATLMHRKRGVFEHFCHDACVLPMSTLPYWQRQFDRRAQRLFGAGLGKNILHGGEREALLERIRREGPLTSRDFKPGAPPSERAVWAKPAHKQTLDYLWLVGELAVSHRKNFSKYYEFACNVYPEELLNKKISDRDQVDWLCRSALQRLAFATTGEIMRFWEACDLDEARLWCEQNDKHLQNVVVEYHDGEYGSSLVWHELLELVQNPPEPTRRLRIINPFDPVMRDRKRLKRLFGFDYRIEMYTPAEKRMYGYYIYPLLEFDRFVGRLEIKYDRQSSSLDVLQLWPEAGVRFGKQRMQQLEREVERLRRFCGAERAEFYIRGS